MGRIKYTFEFPINVKVLFLTTTFPRSVNDNVPRFILDLAKALSILGKLEITVVSPHFRDLPSHDEIEGIVVKRFRYAPSQLERIAYNGGILHNLRSDSIAKIFLPIFCISFISRTFVECIANRPKLIHAHWVLPSGLVAAVIGKTLGIPFITTAHGSDVYASMGSRLCRFLSKIVLKASFAITGNSEEIIENLKVLGAPINSLYKIPMGIDTNIFSSVESERAISGKGGTILFVGRLVESKGVEVLLKAFKIVRERGIDCNLWIVGDGPLKEALEQLAIDLDIKQFVEFKGWVNHALLPVYYRNADVLVIPSNTSRDGSKEGLGLVALEAMAVGTPVISSNLGGLRDLVIKEFSGLLFTPGNSEELAEQIVRLLTNTELWSFCSSNCVNLAKEYDWPEIAMKFLELYLQTDFTQKRINSRFEIHKLKLIK